MTTETEFNISEEPLAERVLRQVQSGQLDESRLLQRLTIQPRKKTHECYSKGNRRPAK